MASLVSGSDFVDQGQNQRCQPCNLRGTITSASMYCSTCTEYLCDECAHVHGISTATKFHTPDRLEDAHKQTNSHLSLYSPRINKICHACLNDIARKDCEVCNKAYCTRCSFDHEKGRENEHHLTDIPKRTLQPPNCDPCKYRKIINEGKQYCKKCNEFLCPFCVYLHQTRKATKDHNIKGMHESDCTLV